MRRNWRDGGRTEEEEEESARMECKHPLVAEAIGGAQRNDLNSAASLILTNSSRSPRRRVSFATLFLPRVRPRREDLDDVKDSPDGCRGQTVRGLLGRVYPGTP